MLMSSLCLSLFQLCQQYIFHGAQCVCDSMGQQYGVDTFGNS